MRTPNPALLALLALAAPAVAGAAVTNDLPAAVPPYVMSLGSDRATVRWLTAGAGPSRVRYRAAGQAEWREAAGAAASAAGSHAVELTGLQPDMSYDVLALDPSLPRAPTRFRTAPTGDDAFTFFVYGDSRSNPAIHRRVATCIVSEAQRTNAFTFTVHAGNLSASGRTFSELYRDFFAPAAPLLQCMPLLLVPGDHDRAGGAFAESFPPPPLPLGSGRGHDFCVDYGGVRLIGLDVYVDRAQEEAQTAWLGERLAGASNRWRLVVLHEPLYSSGPDGPNFALQRRLEPVLSAGGAHAVIASHEHLYERTVPIEGVVHVTTGGGGAPLDAPGDAHPWTARVLPAHHFLAVTAARDGLTIRAIRVPTEEDEEAEAFDRFVLPRRRATPVTNARE